MTRYVYVLISHTPSKYTAMCLISALSIRGVDPDAQITVLCDRPTLAMLRAERHQLLEVADELLDYPLKAAAGRASRILKTTLLDRLQSDFIFLDVDTVVVRPICQRLRLPGSIQMALDRTPGQAGPGLPDWAVPYYAQMGWPLPARGYFNSGVMFVHADEPARLLFAEWNRRWQAFTATGRYLDQPALNSAIDALAIEVGHLPISYNAMVRVDEIYRWGARVIHFFSEASYLDEGTEYSRLIASAASGAVLAPQQIRQAILRRLPLVEPWQTQRHLRAGSLRGAWQNFRSRPPGGNAP